VKRTDDHQVEADVVKLLKHVLRCLSQFDQAAATLGNVQRLDAVGFIALRELGLAGARVYNATAAIQKRLQREAVARRCGRVGVE
jgi:hypothetical protein